MEKNTEPPEELEQPDRTFPYIDSGEEEVLDSVAKGGTIIEQEPNEQLSIKMPSGFEISLSSSKFSLEQVGEIAVKLFREFVKENHTKKGGSYLG